MSGASNFGYGNTAPFANINKSFVNAMDSLKPDLFSTTEIPSFGLSGIKDNISAAASSYPGASILWGGAKKLKKKIRKITKKYKHLKKSNKRHLKQTLRSKYTLHKKTRRRV